MIADEHLVIKFHLQHVKNQNELAMSRHDLVHRGEHKTYFRSQKMFIIHLLSSQFDNSNFGFTLILF